MNDPHNPTATALQLLLSFEGLAKQWEAEGRTEDARMIRQKGPRFAADLSELIAADPASVIPAVQEITAGMLSDLERPNPKTCPRCSHARRSRSSSPRKRA